MPKPGIQGALAVIMKGTWQADGQNWLNPLMVSIRFKWLELPQLLVHVKGDHGGCKQRQGLVLNGKPCFCKWQL